jgi:hypothetical protein
LLQSDDTKKGDTGAQNSNLNGEKSPAQNQNDTSVVKNAQDVPDGGFFAFV